MPNEDYSDELCQWQDSTVEVPPKDMDNRTLGYALEASGDIFRELTCRQWPDGNYIGEKVGRLERLLGNRADIEELEASLSERDEERTDKLQQDWFSLKGLSEKLTAVRNLNIALADQNIAGAKFNLRRFGELYRRQSVHEQRLGGRRPVRSHRRRL